MKTQCKLALILCGFSPFSVWAATHYVWQSSPGPAPPYTNWATAAATIQQAVDAAVAGDEIVVTNGTYASVSVAKPLTLRSVNGPDVTVINGGGTARCLYLTTNGVMVGFTLTNGVARNGGGAVGGTLNNCTLTGNSALDGGGAFGGTLNNCTVTGNSGSGASSATLNNCVVSGNTGGGASGGTLKNCTVTGNSGWGASSATLNNCIVYFNSESNGGNYDSSSTLNYCCTTPQPGNGAGNISVDPELASASHLSVFSPCRGAGSAAYTSGVDIDGEAWGTPPSIGCDEYHAGAVTGALSVSIVPAYTNAAVGFAVGLTARVEGRTTLSLWDLGDGMWALDQPYATHAWTAAGDYQVMLWAFNESQPEGVTAQVTVHVVTQPVYYVAWSSTAPAVPYTSPGPPRPPTSRMRWTPQRCRGRWCW